MSNITFKQKNSAVNVFYWLWYDILKQILISAYFFTENSDCKFKCRGDASVKEEKRLFYRRWALFKINTAVLVPSNLVSSTELKIDLTLSRCGFAFVALHYSSGKRRIVSREINVSWDGLNEVIFKNIRLLVYHIWYIGIDTRLMKGRTGKRMDEVIDEIDG